MHQERDQVAQAVADRGLVVLFVEFTRAVPDELQLWLFASARVVVGMHGGAWGTAVVMGGGQSAVEILTEPKHLKSDMQTRTFLVPSGAKLATTIWSRVDSGGYEVNLNILKTILDSVLLSDFDAVSVNPCMNDP